MPEKYRATLLGTTRKLDSVKTGSLFSFLYNARAATDPNPFIIMVSRRWKAKNGGTYFNGVNLNDLHPKTREFLIAEFGDLPVGSFSFTDIDHATKSDPRCCIRTYNVRNVRALHKVEV